MKRGPYEITSVKEIYKNPWITVHEDTIIRPNGEEGIYGVVEYSPGVAVVALNNKNEVYLVREYAYAINEYNTSIPSGGVDANETPLDAAKRELKEEAGVVADDWIDLGYVNPFTMIIKGPQYLFMAKNALIESEHEEEFEVLTVPFADAYQMVMESKINHAGSCVAILKTHQSLQKVR